MNPRFPCDDYLNAINAAQNPLFNILWDSSFGNNKECLARFLSVNANRPHAVLVYVENGAGRRSRSLEKGDFFPQFSCRDWNYLITARHPVVLQAFADRIGEVTAFMSAAGNVNTQVIIVPALEDCYDSAAWAVLGTFVKERTFYLLARNPSSGSKEIGQAYFKETHDPRKSCSGVTQIANLDGTTKSQSSAKKWLKSRRNCFVSVAYAPEAQGRKKDGSGGGPRFTRKFRVPAGWDAVLGDF